MSPAIPLLVSKAHRTPGHVYKDKKDRIVIWDGKILRCEHERVRTQCRDCGGKAFCQHNRQRSKCKECGGASICQHQRERSQCKECGGGSICHHNRIRSQCKDCGGASICEHNRMRSQCKDCHGSQICHHMRERRRCRECGGSGICQHDRRRSECKECRVPRKTQQPGVVHIVKSKYRIPASNTTALRQLSTASVEGVQLDGTNLLLGLTGTQYKEELDDYGKSAATAVTSSEMPAPIKVENSSIESGVGAFDMFAQAIAMQESPNGGSSAYGSTDGSTDDASDSATDDISDHNTEIGTVSVPTGPELRIDIADGQAYTKQQFVFCYGNTGKWDRARLAGELRIDDANGLPYDRHQFLSVYGNLDKWNHSTIC